MKGFGALVLLGVVYLLIVIFLQDASAEPRGVDLTEPQQQPVPGCLNCHPAEDSNSIKGVPNPIPLPDPSTLPNESIIGLGTNADAKKTDVSSSDNASEATGEVGKSPQLRAQPRQQAQNSSNPFVDMFEVSDPATKNMLDTMYGSYSGDDQCRRKSFCMMGNYVKEMPGRDLFFMLLGGYIPPEYSIYYDIFRNSALYGQNCNVYVCIPTPAPTAAPNNPVDATPQQHSQPR